MKNSDTHSELTSLLISTFLRLRKSSQPIVTEALHYEPISEEANASILLVLQQAVAELHCSSGIPESRTHIIVIKETSIIAIYSGYSPNILFYNFLLKSTLLFRKGTSELKVDEILFLIVVANAFTQSNYSTRNSLIVLDSCIPYSIHIQRTENGLDILILVEVLFSCFAVSFRHDHSSKNLIFPNCRPE